MPAWLSDACLKIKDDVQSVNETKQDELGYLQALNSKENLAAVIPKSIEIFQNAEGRAVTVYKNSYQRIEPEDVSQGAAAAYCTPGNHPDKFQREITFDPILDKLSVPITIKDAELRKYCKDESKASLILMRIKSGIHALMAKTERKLTTEFLTQKGLLVGGGSTIAGDLFRTNQPVRDYGSFIDNVLDQKEEMELRGDIIAVGAGLLKRYSSLTTSGVICCNNAGFDQEEALKNSDIMFYRSPNVKIALGVNPNDVLLWGAKSVIPVYWGKYWGDFDTMSSREQRDLAEYMGFDTHIWANIGNTDMKMPIDMSMRFDNCGENAQWIITLASYAKLDMDIPTETFKVGSRLYGTNGAFLGRPTAV